MKQKKVTNLAIIGLIICFSILFGSCKKDEKVTVDTPPTKIENLITMKGASFSPSSLTVTVGTTVTWKNDDSMAHTVTSTTSVFASDNLGSTTSFTYTFTAAGTFPYKCLYHSGMTGTIIVN